MKELLSSLRSNATNRLRNPIVGAFVLAWCSININGLVVFALSDNEKKLSIASHKVWSVNDDFIYPLLIAIGYLILLPLLNLIYERINDGVYNSIRHERKSQDDIERYARQKRTTSAKIEADEGFIRVQKDKKIERWLEEKNQYRKQLLAIKEKQSENLSQLNKTERELNNLKRRHQGALDLESKRVAFLERKLLKIEELLRDLETKEISKSIRRDIDEIKREYLIGEDMPF